MTSERLDFACQLSEYRDIFCLFEHRHVADLCWEMFLTGFDQEFLNDERPPNAGSLQCVRSGVGQAHVEYSFVDVKPFDMTAQTGQFILTHPDDPGRISGKIKEPVYVLTLVFPYDSRFKELVEGIDDKGLRQLYLPHQHSWLPTGLAALWDIMFVASPAVRAYRDELYSHILATAVGVSKPRSKRAKQQTYEIETVAKAVKYMNDYARDGRVVWKHRHNAFDVAEPPVMIDNISKTVTEERTENSFAPSRESVAEAVRVRCPRTLDRFFEKKLGQPAWQFYIEWIRPPAILRQLRTAAAKPCALIDVVEKVAVNHGLEARGLRNTLKRHAEVKPCDVRDMSDDDFSVLMKRFCNLSH